MSLKPRILLALFAATAFAEEAEDPNRMMGLMKKYGKPGEHHKKLEYFIGKWTSEIHVDMGQGMAPGGGGGGEDEFRWQIPGRFLIGESKGTMMGQPSQMFMILGYDNFKMKYVCTHASSVETALRHSEGVICDPEGKVIVTYGTIDEYLTGEHDKEAKYLWRFLDEDHFNLEVYDLGIGENGRKVLEWRYTRRK